MKKEQIAQALLDRLGGQTYFEIGVRRGRSFAPIQSRRKIGVDPRLPLSRLQRAAHVLARRLLRRRSPLWFELTSDAFFRDHGRVLAETPIDVALVDGLHTYEQALRDVEHCLEHLSPRGVVLMHDCNPTSPAMAHPAPSVDAARALALPGWDDRWCGDVWKAVVHLRALRRDLRVFVLDCDYGVGVVARGEPESVLEHSEAEIAALSYSDLAAQRTRLLNLRPPEHLHRFLCEAAAAWPPLQEKRVHFFLKGSRSQATPRYRGYLMAEALQRSGLSVEVHAPLSAREGGLRERVRELPRLAKELWRAQDGLLYLVRTIYQPDFGRLVWLLKRLSGTPVVFDFDDAKFLQRPRQILRLTRLADAVVVGSHALADWARQHNPRVHLVPTSVPFEVYSRYTHDYAGAAGPPLIGWVGIGPDHLANFELLVPALVRLRRDGLEFRFRLIGALGRREVYDVFEPGRAEGVVVEFVDALDWSRPEHVAEEIGRFEIGVMPLTDTEQNRGKCAFKAVEYMACGVATVCSAVGENMHLLVDERTGLLAHTPEDWYEKLRTLLRDRALRARLGKAGQEVVRARYSLEANAPRLREILAPLSCGRRAL